MPSHLCCYLQIGLSSEDLRLRVLADLVDQVLFEPLYDTLRTKQQLGYTVSSGTRLTHGVTGFCVVVVSAAFDAATVEQRIEAFLQDFVDNTLKVGRGSCVALCMTHKLARDAEGKVCQISAKKWASWGLKSTPIVVESA